MQVVQQQIIQNRSQSGECRRLFHGRGQTFAGYEDLVIDSYPPVVVVTLYRQRDQDWLSDLYRLLQAELPGLQAIFLQNRYLLGSPGQVVFGTLPDEIDACESGLRYRLRLDHAQNIGFFPDMAVGRGYVRKRAAGKTVLNLFAYTCAFSVAALSGGAKHVVNLDMNRNALNTGRLNHRLNGIDLRRASFEAVEFFRSVGRLKRLGPFDLIICDPPATQGKSFTAERHWSKLIRKLPDLLVPGGEVLACLNAPHLPARFIEDLFDEAGGFHPLEGILPGPFFPEINSDSGVTMRTYRWQGGKGDEVRA
ncbi:MAG: SAM-dependent methyltransferase [Desulfuromonas sp.]|nr:MAG: SAM-dependent methyltransferase [Desulfuromonas sp.]